MDSRVKNLRLLAGLILVWWVLLVLFHDMPGLDIQIQSLFFRPGLCAADAGPAAICGTFPISKSGFWVDMRWFFYWLPPVLALVLLGQVIALWRSTDTLAIKESLHQILIALLTWLISVGFLVNFLFKSYSGRPRPINTDVFGGLQAFLPAGGFGGACQSNCSFISGEAASAGWLICLILLLPAALRPVFGSGLVAISIATPILRVAFGGHYPSDVLLGWLISPITFMALVCLAGWKLQRH